ncbi:hypothetical protein D3C72_2379740 [compost metagenome]
MLEADLVDHVALLTTGEASGGAAASADGKFAAVLDAAGLYAISAETIQRDTLTLYRRPA